MLKKVLIGVAALMVLTAGGLYFWAQSVFASSAVREAVERQLTAALGQPVAIGRMGATVFPRVTMTLHEVRIGDPARITAGRLHVGASLGALVSRRIEQGAVHLENARIELPLPPFAIGAPSTAGEDAAAPAVDIVSIDDISLASVEIVSGGRTLRGDVNVSANGTSLTIRRADFTADGTTIGISGRIDDTAGPTGELTASAGEVDVLEVLAFVSDFAAGGVPAAEATAAPAATPMNLAVAIDADRATFGTLALDELSGRVRVTNEAATFEPVRFNVFGGQYDGTLALTFANEPAFTLEAVLANVDLAALTSFAGHPDLVSGRLTGRLAIAGRGTTPDRVLQSTAGTLRIDAVDGAIANLGLVRAVVVATSGRNGTGAALASGGTETAEPYTRLGATLAIADGAASTNDLRFESQNLRLDAAGAFRLDGSAVNLTGAVQLSDELTKQAGPDLVRYTASDGRVTLPATVRGPVDGLSVNIDTAAVLKRAITNRAQEEVQGAIKKGLGGLFNR